MKPERVPVKGPSGMVETKNYVANDESSRYEAQDEHRDLVDGNFTEDPFTLKAHEGDHTPNFTKGPRQAKPEYGKSTGRGNGGVGI